tara:strand:- start:159 stop:983 length:825 start_codon:yes stop_codon:yes gene_type:complete
MGKSETYLTTFDVSAVDYFDLVLDTTVQQEIHVSKDGLKMACWQASDGPLSGVPNGISRVVFSEPDLHIPKFLKKFVQKAQSYNEYSEFYPPGSMTGAVGEDMDACSTTSKRKCVVVPHIGANRITMTFTEYYTEHEESTFENPKCLVRSEVFVKVRSPVIGRAMEQWILKTSREKVAERDRFVKRMLEKSKEQRRKNRRKNSGTKNEKWRRKFYSSQWFEEDSALEESTEGNFVKIETRKSSSEVKLESLESFPIVQKKKAFRRVFSARDLAI